MSGRRCTAAHGLTPSGGCWLWLGRACRRIWILGALRILSRRRIAFCSFEDLITDEKDKIRSDGKGEQKG